MINMGAMISHLFGNNKISNLFISYPTNVSDNTKEILLSLLNHLKFFTDENQVHFSQIHNQYLIYLPKNENLLSINDEDGYNILQRAVGLKNIELTKWLLNYGCDCNRGVCSLPLHIAAYHGPLEIVEVLVKYGARLDCEARTCYSGTHSHNCELSRRPGSVWLSSDQTVLCDRLQSAEYYAIDGDQIGILEFLLARSEDNWLPWHCQKKPLLYYAFEKGAWNCVNYLLAERPEEINQLYDEYFPIHQAVLQDIKFLELLIQCNADLTQRTATQQLTILHVLFLLGKKSANETLASLKLLFEHGCKELLNEPDTLGNTPLHALIVRYSLEESRYNGYVGTDHCTPWSTWDMLHILRYILQQGATQSINKKGNSAIACMLRHVRDWEFRYELLDMLLQHGADANCVGRDGSVPLILCFTPLLNKGLLHLLTHSKKVSYLNCVRILCKYSADPNCSYYKNTLTPLHVLVFSASEYITMSNCDKQAAFLFIRQVLTVLLQHKLNPNINFSQRNQHILLALLDLVQNARISSDLEFVYELSLTLIQFGANPDVKCSIDKEPTICHSQSSVFLKKTNYNILFYYIQHLIKKEELLDGTDSCGNYYFMKLIMLYYHAMSHNELYNCLKQVNQQIETILFKTNLLILTDSIKSLSNEPRSLKSMARNTIYISLKRNLFPNINKLQLPPSLKEYVLNFI